MIIPPAMVSNVTLDIFPGGSGGIDDVLVLLEELLDEELVLVLVVIIELDVGTKGKSTLGS